MLGGMARRDGKYTAHCNDQYPSSRVPGCCWLRLDPNARYVMRRSPDGPDAQKGLRIVPGGRFIRFPARRASATGLRACGPWERGRERRGIWEPPALPEARDQPRRRSWGFPGAL
jgi:hypothetical protein